MKLIALKRLRYPRGPDGKEYDIGDPFETLSDRDAKALVLVRAAKAPDEKKVKGKSVQVEVPVPPTSSTPAADDKAGLFAEQPTERRHYRRRDMKSEE